MEGVAERPELQGVIPNAVGHIFDYIAQQPNTREYLVRASYMEIYQVNHGGST
jgi:kinesin family protein 3/17